MELEVLAGREVTLRERDPPLDDVGQGVHLLGVDPTERQLDANHLPVGLPLAVDALLEAEADELDLFELAAEELPRLGVEVVELALEDRNHVPGDIGTDLGAGERAPGGGCLAGLHRKSSWGLGAPEA